MEARILEGLNPAQRSAVLHGDGPVLILAGAGTGKTRTITRRLAHLVECRGVDPARILAITFTNKAAREMKRRVEEWVPSTSLWVGTFHATCARMLRMSGDEVGLGRDFTILDRDDQLRLAKRLIKENGFDTMVLKPRRVIEAISRWKQRRLGPSAAMEDARLGGLVEERAALIYRAYQPSIEAQNSVDFDDLLGKGAQLLEHPEAGRRWRERFTHVLVDEYQDTNTVQYQLVKLWSSSSGNLAVCGDPDQSIYRWRGADIGNILSFEEDCPGAEVVRLEQNYRSVGNVLKAASAVIQRNRSRKEKDLVTDQPDGEPLLTAEGMDEDGEAVEVATQIQAWLARGVAANEIAVFYRTNASSRALELKLTERQMPYQVVGGLAFFARREIRDTIAYARAVANPRDDLATERILNVPPRGVGATSLERLRSAAGRLGVPLQGAMERDEVRGQLSGPAKKGVGSFLAKLRDLRALQESAESVVSGIIERTGYRRFADALGDTEDLDRGANLDELIAFASEYDARVGGGLRGFLEEIALLSDQDTWDDEAARISLMTVHAAKGLEFDCVAVVGLEEGLFPHARALEDPEGLEEERRLFYVALTRARKQLLLTRSRFRFRVGQPGPQAPSRFFDEIPREVLQEPEYLPDVSDMVQESGYVVGDAVRHETFGVGTVEKVIGVGVNQRVVVRFEDGTTRQLLLAYAPLEPIG